MNTISTTGTVLAMDGQRSLDAVRSVQAIRRLPSYDYRSSDASVRFSAPVSGVAAPTGSDVAKAISQNLEDVKRSADEMQKMSDMVKGHKLQFKVNEELGGIVIDVVDPSTNKVLKEIPSEEMQTLKMRMKQTMGLIFDELG